MRSPVLPDPHVQQQGNDQPLVLLELKPIYEQHSVEGETRRRRHRSHSNHHKKRRARPRVRMRFAWWHLGVAVALIAFGGWLVLAIQPWSVRQAPPVLNQN